MPPAATLLLSALLLAGCAGMPARPEGPIPIAAAPADILACDPATAPLATHLGQAYTCGGLRLEERCEREMALLHGVDRVVCTRRTDRARHEDNMALTARALFWRDAGCGLPTSRASRDNGLEPVVPVAHDRRVRLVVDGCGTQRRYDCDDLADDAAPAAALRCAPASPEVSAYAAAVADTRALFHADTGCPLPAIAPALGSHGLRADEGVTEVLLEGCSHLIPYTCALDPPPHVGHAGQCAPQHPLPEALADAEAQAARLYGAAADCARLGLRPRLLPQPVTLGRSTGFEQVFRAEGCGARGSVLCTGTSFRARRMSCTLDQPALPDGDLYPVALDTARRLRPDCAFTSATSWRSGPLSTPVTVRGTCQEEPLETELRCDAEPSTGKPHCELDAERDRVGTEGRIFALAAYAQATGCPRARTRVVADETEFVHGRYRRRLRVTGCKDSTVYVCTSAEARDGAPSCAAER